MKSPSMEGRNWSKLAREVLNRTSVSSARRQSKFAQPVAFKKDWYLSSRIEEIFQLHGTS